MTRIRKHLKHSSLNEVDLRRLKTSEQQKLFIEISGSLDPINKKNIKYLTKYGTKYLVFSGHSFERKSDYSSSQN